MPPGGSCPVGGGGERPEAGREERDWDPGFLLVPLPDPRPLRIPLLQDTRPLESPLQASGSC